MIIATAGHVDHGKTSLIRALTGVDTDRLAEEKRRGLTIELGFAWLPSESGEPLGFIDVPGHERFIGTMLAGVAGVDMALLVVAADDGVMPQTREHLAILQLLAVRELALVISRCDLVDAAQQQRVAERAHQARRICSPPLLRLALEWAARCRDSGWRGNPRPRWR